MKMKPIQLVLTGACCALALTFGVLAQSAQADVAPGCCNGGGEDLSPVAAALDELEPMNAKPNEEAKYYIYLESASWCGPCRAEMPKIVNAYDDMKEHDVELVLVGRDATTDAVMDYLQTFEAGFPAVLGSDVDKKKDTLPGFVTAEYVPHAVIVDSKGKLIKEGHGSIILQWRDIIAEGRDAANSSQESSDDEGENDEEESTTSVKKLKGDPDKNAPDTADKDDEIDD